MWKKNLLAAGLMLISCSSLAFNGYQLEMIIFSNVNPSTFAAESWPNMSQPSFPAPGLPEGVEQVPSQDFTMAAAQERLNRSPYRTLVHTAWRLSYAQLNKFTTLHLYGGRLFDEQGNVIQNVNDESYPYQLSQNWEVNGKVQIKLNQYFETRFNLALAIPKNQAERLGARGMDQAFLYLPLNESRKVKSKELNYLDHPVYGVIFKITPVDA